MQTNKTKILENVKALGLSPVVINNTDKRSAVRKLLNGLGFATADYIELTMPQLAEIYNGLLGSIGAPLNMIKGCTAEMRSMAIFNFHDTVKGIDIDAVQAAMPTIDVLPEKAVSLPAMKDIKTPALEMNESEALQALRTLLGAGNQKVTIDESAVLAIVQREMASYAKPLPMEIVIKTGAEERAVKTGLFHNQLPNLIKALATGCNIMLVGAAGSGKTTLAHQAADSLGVQFYFNGAISSEYKLTGFVDAQGRIVSTAFRKAYETGGLYLFDEIDASMPDALLAFNAALANGHMDFPDGTIKRHEQFYCVAAANTFGKGADRQYVGRNQLDAASLDRFIVMNIDYDEKLEKALAQNDNWTDKIQKIRRVVYEHKIRHVVSPRASINGAKMLAAGFSESDVLESCVWKGLDADSVRKVKSYC